MKILRTFKCSNEHELERLVKNDVLEVICWCKAKACKQVSSPKFLNNSVGKNASLR